MTVGKRERMAKGGLTRDAKGAFGNLARVHSLRRGMTFPNAPQDRSRSHTHTPSYVLAAYYEGISNTRGVILDGLLKKKKKKNFIKLTTLVRLLQD